MACQAIKNKKAIDLGLKLLNWRLFIQINCIFLPKPGFNVSALPTRALNRPQLSSRLFVLITTLAAFKGLNFIEASQF
jgi:hypothetical protein